MNEELTLEEVISEALFGWGNTSGHSNVVESISILISRKELFDGVVEYLNLLSREYTNLAFNAQDSLKSQAYVGCSRGCLEIVERLQKAQQAVRTALNGG